jgi:subtilisin family serine protease
MSLGDYSIVGQIFYTDPLTVEKVKVGSQIADIQAYKRAIEYATKKGSLVVAAAGNDNLNVTKKSEVANYLNNLYHPLGLSFNSVGFEVPGSIPGVVTVGATGVNDVRANYSNYGHGYIDIAAVGGDTRLLKKYMDSNKVVEYFSNSIYEKEVVGLGQLELQWLLLK